MRERNPSGAAPTANETELQARDVVSVLETGDTNRLLMLITRYPRLPEAILTTDGVGSLGYAAAIGNMGALRILLGPGRRWTPGTNSRARRYTWPSPMHAKPLRCCSLPPERT